MRATKAKPAALLPMAASKARVKGSTSEGERKLTQYRGIDTTPPVTTAEIIGTGTGYNCWYQTASVKLTATDDDSGVALTEYTVLSNVAGQVPPTFHPLPYTGNIIIHTGMWIVDFRSKDNAGNAEAIKSISVFVDNDPPQVDFQVPYAGFTKFDEDIITDYLLNEPLIADYLVVDYFTTMQHQCSGIDTSTIQASVANGDPLDTGSPGLKAITVSTDDHAGNHADYLRHYRVVYHYVPILPPLRRINVIKPDEPVHVKFQLKDYSGNCAGSAIARLYVARMTNGVTGIFLKAVPTGHGMLGIRSKNLCKYDGATSSYMFEMSTKGMAPGKHCLKVKLDDGTEHLSYFTISP